jgi:hypothetical protein
MIVFLQIWSALGPLIGIGLGAYLTRSWQRKQWSLDNKKTEYRELISTLSRSVQRIIHNVPLPSYAGLAVVNPEEEKEILLANVDARSVIHDRIFIHSRLQSENILERWRLLATELKPAGVLEHWEQLHAILVKAAQDELGIKT